MSIIETHTTDRKLRRGPPARVARLVAVPSLPLMLGVRRLAGWVAVGVIGALLELGLVRLLYEGIGWNLPVATAVAAELSVLLKFLASDRLVFGHAVPGVGRALRYHGAAAGAFAVYWVIINGLAGLLSVPYGIGFVIGTGASFLWSVATNFLWVWRRDAERAVRA